MWVQGNQRIWVCVSLQKSLKEISVLLSEIQHYLKYQNVEHLIRHLKECEKMSLFIVSGISLGSGTWKMWVNFIPVASYCLSKSHQTEQGYYNRWVYAKSSWRANTGERGHTQSTFWISVQFAVRAISFCQLTWTDSVGRTPPSVTHSSGSSMFLK